MRLYEDLADWWPLFSSPADYAEEAEFYRATLIEACRGPGRTLLELGSGGGNNASWMKAHFDATLVDRSAGMLDVSRRLNPECEHVQGDMRSVRLGRKFDCVFVHDAISTMSTLDDLRAVLETAFAHCAPGGAALFAPDHLRENFRPSTEAGGHDDGDRGVRYLEWTWDPDASDTTCTVDYAIMLRETDGSVTVVHDRCIEGLFARSDWLRLLADVGFDATARVFEHSELEPGSYEVFVATCPDSADAR